MAKKIRNFAEDRGTLQSTNSYYLNNEKHFMKLTTVSGSTDFE